MKTGMWVEKYRPTKFDEVIGVPPELPKLVGDSLPHILITGPPGTGKTTIGRIIVKEMDAECLYLNASDERGVEIIREKVKRFCSTCSLSDKSRIKIAFLDEGDGLTRDSQQILRNLMETYHKHCRFILTGNYPNKIIEPLKSRCQQFELKRPSKPDVMERLAVISGKENMQTTPDDLKKIVDRFYPDIRSCIKHLQLFSVKGRLELGEEDGKELYRFLKEKNITSIRRKIIKENTDLSGIIGTFEELIMDDSELDGKQKMKLILLLADFNRSIPFVIIPRIEFEDFCFKALEVLK